MTAKELDAAGITTPELRAAYTRCRDLNQRYGRTFFLATRLLCAAQRPAIHALYGFARWADDIVDEPGPDCDPDLVRHHLETLGEELSAAMREGYSDNPVLVAVADTTRRFDIPTELFDDFLRSMRMDLTVTDYATRADLEVYVRGSAEVIGLQVLPVLGTTTMPQAAPRAAALGKAFQLTNFLRDIAEDFRRGRVYLPADELGAFGVDRDLLYWCTRHRRTEARVRNALAHQIATARAVYRRADPGIALLHPVSRPCVATARILYSEILDRIESTGYDVFGQRATVPTPRRAAVAAAALGRAMWARSTVGPPPARAVEPTR